MAFREDYHLMPDDPVVLHAICSKQSHDKIATLVSEGADVDQPDGWGNTPLHFACNSGDFELANLLLSLGANPNAENREGYTPLGRVRASDEKLMNLILSAGGRLG